MKNLVIFLALLTGIANLTCMQRKDGDQHQSTQLMQIPRNIQPEIEIGPNTVLGLLEREGRFPQSQVQAVTDFLRQNPKLTTILSGVEHQKTFFCGTQDERTALRSKIISDLTEMGIKSLSEDSVIFPLPTDPSIVLKDTFEYLARQGLKDTRVSEKAGKRMWGTWADTLTPEEFEEFQAKHGKVFQTTSRVIVYLLALQTLRKYNITSICIPKTDLVQLPGRPNDVCDANFTVIQENIGVGEKLENTPLAINEDVVLDMANFIDGTGVWWMEGNYIVKDGKVTCLGNQWPNRHHGDPNKHPNKDPEHKKWLVTVGWEQLEKQIILHYANKHKIDVTELLKKKHQRQDELMPGWRNVKCPFTQVSQASSSK